MIKLVSKTNLVVGLIGGATLEGIIIEGDSGLCVPSITYTTSSSFVA